MSDHTSVRLETTSGTVIAYLAPNFEVKPTFKNDLFSQDATEGKSIVRDHQIIAHELVAQGVFMDSREVRDAHRTDLENLFGTSPVTPRDQVNRVVSYVRGEGGPYHFYEGSDSYTATDSANVDVANGVYPVVQVDEFRPPQESGRPRFEYMLRMKVGVPR